MDNGRRENTSLDLGGVGVDLKTVVAKVRVVRPIEKANALLNGSPTVLWKRNGKLDHVGGLSVRELDIVALIGIDLENVDGHVYRLPPDLLGHPNYWNTRQDRYIVFLPEVLRNADLLGAIVWIREGS